MADEKNLKLQRDRFLAFAFASSDLFIEISEEGKITYALGAAKGMTGIDESTLIGKDWLELFSAYDQALMSSTYDRAKPGLRCGPLLVNLNETFGKRQALWTGIKMPGNNKFYTTLGLSNAVMSKVGQAMRVPEDRELLTRENFTEAAQDALAKAKSMGQDVNMTMFDFAADERDKIGEEAWGNFVEALSEILIAKSFDGYSAGEIADGRYSLIHDKDIDADKLREEIAALAAEKDPSGEGMDIASKTVTADLQTMSDRDASRALLYTIHEFERKGTDITIDTLNSGFESYVSANAQKIKEFQGFIERSSFAIHFQPIVNLENLEATHFEMLCRFENGDTQEWVMFGEDIGLAPEFDIAVCERAINYVKFKAGGTRTRFSINLSGQSIEDEKFFEKLNEKLDKHKNLSDRLMFEITESTHIENLDTVSKFVSQLREKGFQVALDDFGAGTASFQYLQKLDVDFVKIDGKYTRKLLTSQRDVAMVKNLTQMCKDLEIKVIAEFVEDQNQLSLLKEMGVDYGQGYYFGKPQSQPDYHPPQE